MTELQYHTTDADNLKEEEFNFNLVKIIFRKESPFGTIYRPIMQALQKRKLKTFSKGRTLLHR
jgi:hypothetical protein